MFKGTGIFRVRSGTIYKISTGTDTYDPKVGSVSKTQKKIGSGSISKKKVLDLHTG
jgi:hypothetical protein